MFDWVLNVFLKLCRKRTEKQTWLSNAKSHDCLTKNILILLSKSAPKNLTTRLTAKITV